MRILADLYCPLVTFAKIRSPKKDLFCWRPVASTARTARDNESGARQSPQHLGPATLARSRPTKGRSHASLYCGFSRLFGLETGYFADDDDLRLASELRESASDPLFGSAISPDPNSLPAAFRPRAAGLLEPPSENVRRTISIVLGASSCACLFAPSTIELSCRQSFSRRRLSAERTTSWKGPERHHPV